MADGSVMLQLFASLAMSTPAMTGRIFLKCLPVALKPTTVKIPPMVGPFKSAPTMTTNSMVTRPFTPILIMTAAPPSDL